jgi:hypothetical protein
MRRRRRTTPWAPDRPPRLNELVAEALMVPLGVILRHELRHRAPKVTLAKQDHAM